MKGLLGICACALLALAASSAAAEETTWEVTGSITSFTDTAGALPAGLAVGVNYRMVITFDNAIAPSQTFTIVCTGSICRAPLPGETPTGRRYNIVQPEMKINVFAGGSCNPCEFTSAAGGSMFIRDNFPVTFGSTHVPTDGVTFVIQDDGLDVSLILRTENLSLGIITGPNLPYLAPGGLADLETSVAQICNSATPFCGPVAVQGDTRTVSNATYGIGYIFTARDCRVPAIANLAVDPRPYDCINLGAQRANTWSDPGRLVVGGGLGYGIFVGRHTVSSSMIDASWNDGLGVHGALGLPDFFFGIVRGSVEFNGPAAFPIVRGQSSRLLARSNANLFAFQKYNYTGGVTQLPLAFALTYIVQDFSNDPSVSPQIPDRPGGATVGVTMSIIDGNVRMESVNAAGRQTFREVACGNEAQFGWPPGSILGTALFDTVAGERVTSFPRTATRVIASCANPGQAVQLAANQSFIVATGMQTPARGRQPQPPHAIAAPDDGLANAFNTLHVTFDPAAPPELVRALADAITPACADCGLAPETLGVGIDIKPGSTDNCINPDSHGVIPIALFGSAEFAVADLRVDDSLRLGSLGLRVRGKGSQCSVTAIDGDSYADMICHFENASEAWQTGQGTAAVSGKLNNGVPIAGSDAICLVR